MVKEIWSFLELEKEKLHDTAIKMATEARRDSKLLETKPCGIFFGPSDSLLNELELYGLEKIYFFKTRENPTPEIIADNLFYLISRMPPFLIVFPPTPNTAEVAARIAAKLGKGFISNCVDFELSGGNLVVRKPIYGGKAYGYYTWRNKPPYIATINLTSLEALEADIKIQPEIVHEEYKGVRTKASLLKRWKMPLSDLDIAEARLVVGVGNGVDKKEFMGVIEQLAELLEGVIGGTRVAVFRGLIPVERQIGATGKFINADIYMPMGISGSNRHTSGIRNVKHVVPINTHKEAPIFKFAELGVVNDLYEVVPHLIEIIREELEAKGN